MSLIKYAIEFERMVPSLDSPLGRHIQGLMVSEAKSMRPGRRTFTGTERTAQFRCILLSWLSAVCEELALCRETWYLAVRLIDGHIAAIAGPTPRPASWQVIGSAALLAAGKTCETVPPGIAEIVAPLAGTSGGAAAAASQVRIAELELVQGAHFTILVPTAIDWVKAMCECIAGASSAVHAHYEGFVASSTPSGDASDVSIGLQRRPKVPQQAQGTPLPACPSRRAASGDEWSVVSVDEEAPCAQRTSYSTAHSLPLSADLYVALLTAPGVRGPDITSRVTAFMPLPPNAAAAAACHGLALKSPLFTSARVAPAPLQAEDAAATAATTAARAATTKTTDSDHNRFRPIRLFSDVMSLIDAATLHVRSFDFAPSIVASAAMLVVLQSYNNSVASSLAAAGESTADARARLLLNSDAPNAAMARLFAMHPLVFEIVHLAVIGVVRVRGLAAKSDSAGAPVELPITTPHSASSRAAAASAAAAAIAADEMAAAASQTGSSGRKRARFSRGCGSEPDFSDSTPSVSNDEPNAGGSRRDGFCDGRVDDFEGSSVEAQCDYRWASLRQCVTWLTLLSRDLPEHVSPASAAHIAALNISPDDVPFLQPCNPLLRAHVRSHLSAFFSGTAPEAEAQEGIAASFPALFADWRVAHSDAMR
jgi:hypothetical protein